MKKVVFGVLVVGLLVGAGCSKQGESDADGGSLPVESGTPAASQNDQASEPARGGSGTAGSTMTEQQLREALIKANPGFSGRLVAQGDGRSILAVAINERAIKDISPLSELKLELLDLSECSISDISALEGMKLEALALEKTKVKDIGALKGMPLTKVFLAESQVTDLSPLAGAPIEQLNLLGTPVTDLSPLSSMGRLEMLWLNDTPVSDISPLADVPLVSLTLAGTKVSDLSPLKGTKLQRLHIARANVSDLSPLGSLKLTRLVFTPRMISSGMDAVRKMSSLSELGTSFGEEGRPDELMPPQVFWQRYDSGDFK